jgi:pimeloyl-ACP methyl ester carboxylesterase
MSLQEGLQRNLGFASPLAFELVYWADIQYPEPIPEAELDNPYITADRHGPLPRYGGTALDTVRAIAEKWGGRAIDRGKDLIGLDEHVDSLLGIAFDDLRDYYGKSDVRNRVRNRLANALQRHTDNRVCLIAHSMGSIIAYDVLRMLEQHSPGIDHFVTIGSPLGLPVVTQHVREEFSNTLVPQQVRQWTNLADPRDKIALDCSLADDYRPTPGGIRVQDDLVRNDYVDRAGKNDQHNGYGYLRTPELSDIVHRFLGAGTGARDDPQQTDRRQNQSRCVFKRNLPLIEIGPSKGTRLFQRY